MFYPAGMIMDHWGRKYASVPSFFVQSMGMAAIPLAQDFSGLLLALVVVGLGNGIGSGTMMTLGARIWPRTMGGGCFWGCGALSAIWAGRAAPWPWAISPIGSA